MTWFAYVFPCAWEDHCKIGYSGDPLARLQQLHRRWFDLFDLERGFLIEGESQRDARDLELQLRRPLAACRAPMPLTIRKAAGGFTEWFRGAQTDLQNAAGRLAQHGYRVHAPLYAWLRSAMDAQADLLYEWAAQTLRDDTGCQAHCNATSLRALRDTLDAYSAFGFALDALPAHVLRWYGATTHGISRLG